MTAIGYRTGVLADPVAARRALVAVLGIAAAIAYVLFRNQWTLPHNDDAPLFRSLNDVHDAVADNRTALEPIRAGVAALIDVFGNLLASLGWPGVIGLAGALGLVFGGVRLAVLAVLGFASLGILGLWDESMATLGMMLAAVVIALASGCRSGSWPVGATGCGDPLADPRRDADHADAGLPDPDHAAVPRSGRRRRRSRP